MSHETTNFVHKSLSVNTTAWSPGTPDPSYILCGFWKIKGLSGRTRENIFILGFSTIKNFPGFRTEQKKGLSGVIPSDIGNFSNIVIFDLRGVILMFFEEPRNQKKRSERWKRLPKKLTFGFIFSFHFFQNKNSDSFFFGLQHTKNTLWLALSSGKTNWNSPRKIECLALVHCFLKVGKEFSCWGFYHKRLISCLTNKHRAPTLWKKTERGSFVRQKEKLSKTVFFIMQKHFFPKVFSLRITTVVPSVCVNGCWKQKFEGEPVVTKCPREERKRIHKKKKKTQSTHVLNIIVFFFQHTWQVFFLFSIFFLMIIYQESIAQYGGTVWITNWRWKKKSWFSAFFRWHAAFCCCTKSETEILISSLKAFLCDLHWKL